MSTTMAWVKIRKAISTIATMYSVVLTTTMHPLDKVYVCPS